MDQTKNREFRSFAEFLPNEYLVEGYASTFEPYKMCEIDGEEYFERIEPTAFDNTDMTDVVFRVDHTGPVYGRTSAGTRLRLSYMPASAMPRTSATAIGYSTILSVTTGMRKEHIAPPKAPPKAIMR